jgi:hypothetical protein
MSNLPLEVAVRATKPRHAAKEPLEVEASVTNVSAAPLLVNARLLLNLDGLEGELFLEVRTADGQPVPFQSMVLPAELKDGHFRVLQPGEALRRTLDLAERYTGGEPGDYEVRAVYRNEAEWTRGGLVAWTGSASSQPVRLSVR